MPTAAAVAKQDPEWANRRRLFTAQRTTVPQIFAAMREHLGRQTTRALRSRPPTSPKKNYANCCPPPQTAPMTLRSAPHRFTTGAPRRKSPKSTARRHDRDLVARDPGVPHTGSTNAPHRRAGTGWSRVKRVACGFLQHRELTPPDTLPLHQPSGPAPEFTTTHLPVNPSKSPQRPHTRRAYYLADKAANKSPSTPCAT